MPATTTVRRSIYIHTLDVPYENRNVAQWTRAECSCWEIRKILVSQTLHTLKCVWLFVVLVMNAIRQNVRKKNEYKNETNKIEECFCSGAQTTHEPFHVRQNNQIKIILRTTHMFIHSSTHSFIVSSVFNCCCRCGNARLRTTQSESPLNGGGSSIHIHFCSPTHRRCNEPWWWWWSYLFFLRSCRHFCRGNNAFSKLITETFRLGITITTLLYVDFFRNFFFWTWVSTICCYWAEELEFELRQKWKQKYWHKKQTKCVAQRWACILNFLVASQPATHYSNTTNRVVLIVQQ